MFLLPMTRAEITIIQDQLERTGAYRDRLVARSRLLPDAGQREATIATVDNAVRLCQSYLHDVSAAQVTAYQVELLYTTVTDLGQHLGALRIAIEKAEQAQQIAATVLPLSEALADRISTSVRTPAALDAYQQLLDRAGASLDRLVARSQVLPDHATRQELLAEIQAVFIVSKQQLHQVRHFPNNVSVAMRFAVSVHYLGTCLSSFRQAVIQSEPAQPQP